MWMKIKGFRVFGWLTAAVFCLTLRAFACYELFFLTLRAQTPFACYALTGGPQWPSSPTSWLAFFTLYRWGRRKFCTDYHGKKVRSRKAEASTTARRR